MHGIWFKREKKWLFHAQVIIQQLKDLPNSSSNAIKKRIGGKIVWNLQEKDDLLFPFNRNDIADELVCSFFFFCNQFENNVYITSQSSRLKEQWIC